MELERKAERGVTTIWKVSVQTKILFFAMDYKILRRKQLQELCKKHNIECNQSNSDMSTTLNNMNLEVEYNGLLRYQLQALSKEKKNSGKLSNARMIEELKKKSKAYVYSDGPNICAAFLANLHSQVDTTVKFNGAYYNLPAWSVSILPDCKNVVFNTAKVSSQTTSVQLQLANSTLVGSSSMKRSYLEMEETEWSWLHEPIGIWGKDAFFKHGLVEQINKTGDSSNYLWYTTIIDVDDDEAFLKNGIQPVLHVESLGHHLHAFINEMYAGSKAGNQSYPNITTDQPILLKSGRNPIQLLSLTVGLQWAQESLGLLN